MTSYKDDNDRLTPQEKAADQERIKMIQRQQAADFLRGMSWQEMAMILHRNFIKDMGLVEGTTQHTGFMALAIAGEAGELANLAKKDWRGYPGDRLDKVELAKELADIMIYVTIMAEIEGINLEIACHYKMLECVDRWPEMFKRSGR